MAHLGADGLGVAQQVEDGASSLHSLEQRIDLGAAGRRIDMHGVADIVRPDRCRLVAGLAAARVDDARDLDFEALQRHLALGRLDQKDMGHAGAQHAQLQLGRAWAQVVACEVGWAVADDLVLADAQTAHAAAPLGTHAGLESGGLGRARRNGGAACQHSRAFFGKIFVEMTHERAFDKGMPGHCCESGTPDQQRNSSALMRSANMQARAS